MNRVTLMGNLGKDAELRVLANGNAIAKFTLATTEKWKNSEGEPQEKTQWHRCSMFGKRASALAQHLKKGTKLVVEGSIDYGSYEKEGVKHYTTDIKVSNVEFAGGTKTGGTSSESDGGSAESFGAPDPDPANGEDIPF